MSRIKNPDVAAIVAMLGTLLAEVVVRIAADESLLAQLPPWLGPLVLAVAASLRLQLGRSRDANPTSTVEGPDHG